MYVEPYQRTAFTQANPGGDGVPRARHRHGDRAQRPGRVQGAGQRRQYYGIGYQSVASAFDLVNSEVTSWYHLP